MITPGDRSDVVLAVVSAHAAEGFPSLSAIVLNGGLELHPSIAALVSGLGLRLPIVATALGTFETASAVASARGRVTATSQRKIDTALALVDKYVDIGDLLAQLAIPIPTVTTPQMFEYRLLERARSDCKRIVLPEGDDDRILKAAGRLLQRRVADLTILGDEAQIRSRAAELGVDLDAATVLNPRTSELCDQFAEQYAQLRKRKGVTVEQARETIHDVSYFGTMLVHNDIVDGMVSGAVHTTAHTVRPAFEIIKTRPDVSTVSSIFLMCLATRCSPTATARSSRIRPPNSPPLSRSRRHARPVRYRSPGWRCCPIPPVGRATAWLEIILAATDLVSWAKLIGFAADPDLATCEIDTFRYRVLHVAARITRGAPQIRLRIDATWRRGHRHIPRMATRAPPSPEHSPTIPPTRKTPPPGDTGRAVIPSRNNQPHKPASTVSVRPSQAAQKIEANYN